MAKNTKGGSIEIEVTSKGSLQKLGKEARRAGKDVGSIAKNTAESDRRLKSLSNQTSNSSKAFSKQAQTIQGGLVPVYATLAAQVFAVSAAFRFLQDSVNFRNLVAGQAAYGAATGTMFSTISKAVREASNGLISYQDASQAVAIGTAAGLNAGQLERLGKAASDVSLALGRDVVDSFNRLVRGVTKAEPELLDELGIILRLDPALKQYAAQLGKSKEDLNQFERAQAVTNFVLDQAESKFGKISQVISPTAFALGQFQQAFNDMLNDLQVGIAGIVDFVAPFFTQNIQAFAAALLIFVSSIVKSMLPNFDMMVAKGAQTVTALKAQIKQMEGEVRVLGATQTIKSKGGAERMRREGLADVQSIDPTVGSLSNQQISARLRVLRSGKELTALKGMTDDKVAIYTSGLEKMEAANKFHKGKEVIEVQTAEQKKQLAHAQTTLKQEQELLKQEEKQRRNAKIAVGIFRAIYIAGFVVMAAQATKAAIKFLTTTEEQREEFEKEAKAAKDLSNNIKDINNNLETMIKLRAKGLVDSPFTQFARSLQSQNLIQQAQDLAMLDPESVKRGRGRAERQALLNQYIVDGGLTQDFIGKFLDDQIQVDEDAFAAVTGFLETLTQLRELSPTKAFDDIFAQMIDNLEKNGKIMPLTLKQFGELQQEIIKTEQSARQFNQTSQDLQKGLTGLATSFAPKTTFMNIQQLVDTNRKSLTDARNILRDDLSILGRETLKDENFLVSDAQFEEFVKRPTAFLIQDLKLDKDRRKIVEDRIDAIKDQNDLLTQLQPILDTNLIKERAINLEVAENKTAKAAIVKDGSALQAQLTRQLDLEEKSLNITKSRTKEEGLQQLIKSDKIKKDPALLNALEHALEIQKEITKQMESQQQLALQGERIRRDSLLNAQRTAQDTTAPFSMAHMFGLTRPISEDDIRGTMDRNPGFTREEAIQNLQKFNAQLKLTEVQMNLIDGLSTSIGTTLVDGLANAFVEVAKGTQTFADAFKNMAIQILADIAAMTMKMAIFRALAGFFVGPVDTSVFTNFSTVDTSTFTNPTAGLPGFNAQGFNLGTLGRSGGIMSSPGYRSYARGGIAMGPDSGYAATLHGTEAVVPLGNSRSIPVELKGEGGGVNNITVNVNGGTEGNGQSPEQAKALGNMIQVATMEIIQREKRPGGVLSK